MKVMTKLIGVEAKLLSRDVGLLTFGLAFPAVLLTVLGLLPGFRDADPDLGGLRLIDVYTPVILVLTYAMVGVSSVATLLATYRQQGVLRRLRVTPVGPSRLLIAHLAAQLLLAMVATGLAIAVALLVYDVGGPSNWFGAIAGLVLAAAALFAIGLAIGAVAPSGTAAGTIGTFVWLPVMVLAGLWFPREAMPDAMRRVSDLSPGGAAVDAVQTAWFSGASAGTSFAVLVTTVLVVGVIATVTFRWE